jgi:cobalt-precorrin-5B (C1)-methyltransferase
VDNALLAEITTRAGGSTNLVEEVENANTARHAYELWRSADLTAATNLLCQQAADNLAEYAKGELEVHVILVDFDTLEPAGASAGALELTTWGRG